MRACPACNARYGDEVAFCTKDGTQVVVDRHAAPVDGMIGQTIERYRLVRKLGEGGMGEVYEAEHVNIEKRVALKLLRPEILSNQEAVQRFKQEARSASSIGHENIIEIDDFGTLSDGSGRVFLIMEFLHGEPLAEILKQPVPLPRALEILIQTGRGLAAAHAKGIVHRDMKPENVFVTRTRDGKDQPKILDFGIAKVSGADENQQLTRTGTIFGTPFYMAPEQALGQKLDHRADIYAMGVIMYEVFTGTVPFKAESFMGILTQHITTPPAAPAEVAAAHGRQIPPEVEQIILTALRKNPAERFPTMNDLVAALLDVYRRYVGAGMTAPLAAPPMSPSQVMNVPRTGAIAAQGGMGITPVPTPVPQPMAGHPSQAMAAQAYQAGHPAHVPAGTPMPAPMGSGYYGHAAQAPKRGKGLAITLVLLGLVLAGGGGAAWYFLLGPGKTDPTAAAAGGTTGDPGKTDPGKTDPDKSDPGKSDPGKTDPAPAAVPDAGTAVALASPDAASARIDPQVEPVPPADVVVEVSSEPPRAAVLTADGILLGKAPRKVTVKAGEAVDLVLRLRGYEDTPVRVDGAETAVSFALTRKRRHGSDLKPNPLDKKPDGTQKNGNTHKDPRDHGLVDDEDKHPDGLE